MVLILLLVTTALVGAKLVSGWERGRFDPLLFELGSGFRYPGGIIGLVLGVACARWTGLYSGPTARLADVLAAAIPAGMAVARLGCFATGCCFGTVSHLPWAVTYGPPAAAWGRHVRDEHLSAAVPLSLPVHPVQLYEAALCILLTAFLLRFQRRPHRNGEPFVVCVIALALIRLTFSPLRADLPGYVRAIDAIVLAAAIFGYLVMRPLPLSFPPSHAWTASPERETASASRYGGAK
jgi:phosphatidylglycerol:prolipoprotein diacylglycerol transferase